MLNDTARGIFTVLGLILLGVATALSLCKGIEEGFAPTPGTQQHR
jgi:hypothetical protein